MITAWRGPYLGTGPIPAQEWRPYQKTTFPTPPFPEYVSGHSTFSAAGAEVLRTFTGTDAFGASVTIRAGTSFVEPRTSTNRGVPASDVRVSWPTYTAAADEAGVSRRYGGIHFIDADLHGRTMGAAIGAQALSHAQRYWDP
jgi:PAP2 superfamily